MSYWIFQAVPERYNLVQMMSLSGDRWFVTRYHDEIKIGDIVFFWQAGGGAGLYGWGNVTSPQPYLVTNGDDKGDYKVDVSYNVRFPTNKGQVPIPKAMIKQENELKELSILRAPQGTNFRVEPGEAKALKALIQTLGFIAPP